MSGALSLGLAVIVWGFIICVALMVLTVIGAALYVWWDGYKSRQYWKRQARNNRTNRGLK